jgi:hypothetical protein
LVERSMRLRCRIAEAPNAAVRLQRSSAAEKDAFAHANRSGDLAVFKPRQPGRRYRKTAHRISIMVATSGRSRREAAKMQERSRSLDPAFSIAHREPPRR